MMTFRRFESFYPASEKAPLIEKFFHKVRVDEVDACGVVWCVRYASYFEQGRGKWGQKFGFCYQDMIQNGFAMPIVQFHADYYHPLRLNETLCIQTQCLWTEGAKMNFRYQIDTENNTLAVQGYTIQIFTDLAGKLMVIRPEFAEKFFQKWDRNLQK
ncbi:MAG TPA: acyl-CoA thioesterase [Firmicutes bacterium]|jgi:acyl-CoA thioester hydrolase|nr:acyl-CoA thioesterase [Bacillota bacterium]